MLKFSSSDLYIATPIQAMSSYVLSPIILIDLKSFFSTMVCTENTHQNFGLWSFSFLFILFKESSGLRCGKLFSKWTRIVSNFMRARSFLPSSSFILSQVGLANDDNHRLLASMLTARPWEDLNKDATRSFQGFSSEEKDYIGTSLSMESVFLTPLSDSNGFPSAGNHSTFAGCRLSSNSSSENE